MPVVYLHTTPLYPESHAHTHTPKKAKELLPNVKPDVWYCFKQINTLDTGGVTVQTVDDQLLSVQPGGQWETRPLGTHGQYEVATLNGSTIVFNPGGNVMPWVYPCITSVV